MTYLNADQNDGALDPDTTIEWIPALRAYARSLTRDAHDADDLVQETLLKAVRNRHKFRKESNLRAWLFTIMRNSFYNTLLKTRRESPADGDCASTLPAVAAPQNLRLRRNEVLRAVDRLPMPYREAFIFVAVLGESYEDSAQTCSIRIGTVKSRVNRARTMLIQALEPVEAIQLEELSKETGSSQFRRTATPAG